MAHRGVEKLLHSNGFNTSRLDMGRKCWRATLPAHFVGRNVVAGRIKESTALDAIQMAGRLAR